MKIFESGHFCEALLNGVVWLLRYTHIHICTLKFCLEFSVDVYSLFNKGQYDTFLFLFLPQVMLSHLGNKKNQNGEGLVHPGVKH